MLKSIEGVYREGRIDLLEVPQDIEEARVIVTFQEEPRLTPNGPPMTRVEIAELRWRLSAFEEDWNAPGMEVYDTLSSAR